MTARDVDGGRIAWREAGRGPAVVLLHGLGGSRTAWEPQLAGLSDRWRVIAWDMPGYGASPALDGPLDFGRLADAVVVLMEEAGVPAAHVVGLSMGGMVAQHLALRHPGRVRSLALLDTSPRFGLDGTTTAEGWIAARLEPIEAGGTPSSIAASVVAAIAAPGADRRALEQAEAAFARIPVAGFREAVRCLPTHDLQDRLAEIRVPTLVVVGELDQETPVAYAEALAAGIPGSRLVVIPGAGHLSNLEKPGEVNAALRELFAGAEAREPMEAKQ